MNTLDASILPGPGFLTPTCEPEVVEIPLLLSVKQVAALELAARDRGLTAGQMLRHLVRDYLTQSTRDPDEASHVNMPW